jgi:hypothetical protein
VTVAEAISRTAFIHATSNGGLVAPCGKVAVAYFEDSARKDSLLVEIQSRDHPNTRSWSASGHSTAKCVFFAIPRVT